MKNFTLLIVICLVLTIHAQAQPKGTSLVIIDPSLPSLDILLSQIHPDSKVIYLDRTENPLASISRILKAHAPVCALHILSEGNAGVLSLSGMPITSATLNESSHLLENWRDYFINHGDILLYGCEVAKGEVGMRFVQNMAVLTGLDIAASDDPTGSWRKNGDWYLEFKSGTIETRLVVARGIIEQYPTILNIRSSSKNLPAAKKKRKEK